MLKSAAEWKKITPSWKALFKHEKRYALQGTLSELLAFCSRMLSLPFRAGQDMGPCLYWAFWACSPTSVLGTSSPQWPSTIQVTPQLWAWGKSGTLILTRAGKEGVGDELGDWPGRFKILNLGTTATLTLRRGIFCGKRRNQAYCHGGSRTPVQKDLKNTY